jgi:hypothetical protein
MNSEKKFVIVGLSCGIFALFVIMFYAGMGHVRHVNIFWPEEINQTLEFRNLNGDIVVVGTVGNGGTNPELVMRTGDYFYIITVVNNDNVPHQLSVDGFNVSTKLLEPGESDKITLRTKNEATFNYYDTADDKKFLGTIRAVKVVLFE